jgi:DNA-binding CsgD family transcriptional regulator
MSEESNSPANCAAEQTIPPHSPYLGDFGKFHLGRDANLSDKQLHAIDLTIQGYPDIRIAEMLEIDRRTLWYWKTKNEDYRQLLFLARDNVHMRVTDRYHDLLTRAWSVIEASLDHHKEENRFQAAKSLLHMAGAFQRRALKKIPQEDEPRDRQDRTERQLEKETPTLPPKMG